MHERILIDPGHGGSDPGSVGFVQEANVTHAWGIELAWQINNLGGDTYILPDGVDWLNDLSEPVRIANEYGLPWLYIALHANAGGGTGAEIYVHNSAWCNKKTASLAHSVFNAYMSVASKNGLANRGVKAGNYYVLRNTKNRAVLIELGFVDNSIDANLLINEKFKKEACSSMARALMKEAGQTIREK